MRVAPYIVPFPMVSGEHDDVEVPVENAGTEPARLVGSLDYCGGSCVLGQKLPTPILARGTEFATVRIESRTPGPLQDELPFYTDRMTQPVLMIQLKGTVLETPCHAFDPTTRADGV